MTSRRENFEKTMRHQTPDSLILDFGGNPLSTMEGQSQEKFLDFLGYQREEKQERLLFGQTPDLDERILKEFDIDTRSVGGILPCEQSSFQKISDEEYIDEWGIRRRFTGLYWEAVNAPLKDATIEEMENYPFPDPDSIPEAMLQNYEKKAKYLFEETDYVVCGEHPVYGVFELGCWLCGFDNFLYRTAAEPEFVEAFFERLWEYQKKVIEIYYGRIGKYLHYTSSGDDFATQNGPFLSPAMFEELIQPYLKKRIEYTKKYTDAYFLHHSCGSVTMLLPNLIESGVEILNPIQPKAKDMESAKLKEAFGDQIVFHGGVDTQELLPFGGREEIEESVARTIEILNKDGGYLFAAAHNIQEDVNPENLAVMLQAARKYGRK